MIPIKFIVRALLASICLTAAGDTLMKVQVGYRNINSSYDSFKIDAPTAVNIGLAYFITNNVALEGSIGTVWGKFKYTNKLYGYNIGSNNSGRIMFIINTAAQYHFNRGNQLKPYIGIGYSHRPTTTFYTSFAHEEEIFCIGGGGNFLMQLGLDIKLTEDYYFNIDIKHMRPVSHVLNVVELNIKPIHYVSNTEITAGIAFSI